MAARIADCPALADLIDEAIALVGRDVLDGHDEVLYRRLEELEAISMTWISGATS